MSAQAEILSALVQNIKASVSLPFSLEVGPLPVEDSVRAVVGPGGTEDTYFDKRARRRMVLLFLCKSDDQIVAYNAVADIANYLHTLKDFPTNSGWEILTAYTTTEPQYVGKEENGRYVYSSIVDVEIYF